MKMIKIIPTLVLLALFLTPTSLSAQTFHQDLYDSFVDLPILCLNKDLSGEWTYSVSYHVDKKTGTLTRIHWNVKSAFLYDPVDGTKYHIVDTGNDSFMGPADGLEGWSYVDLWNNIEASNLGIIDYVDIDDGWLDAYPVELPYEGTVSAMFRINGGGEHFFLREYIHYEVNARGELILDRKLLEAECNE